MAVPVQSTSTDIIWPNLPLADWQDTYTTLHLWTHLTDRCQVIHLSENVEISR